MVRKAAGKRVEAKKDLYHNVVTFIFSLLEIFLNRIFFFSFSDSQLIMILGLGWTFINFQFY